MTEPIHWHEDPERPGVLVPDREIVLGEGDSFSVSSTMIDGVMMPWAEGEITRA